MQTQFRSRRIELELTQVELAAALGVGQPAVSHWEKGRCAPQGFALKRKVKALMGRTVDELRQPEKQSGTATEVTTPQIGTKSVNELGKTL